MKIKGIVSEDFTNYKKPSLFIATTSCNWKCCIEGGFDVSLCQNSSLSKSPTKEIDNQLIIDSYLNNPLTNAIVFGGLEPLDSFDELFGFLWDLRIENNCEDDVVIYTGYTEDEVLDSYISKLNQFHNVIIKFGRYVPNQKPHLDEVLGIQLASDNQYAKKIS